MHGGWIAARLGRLPKAAPFQIGTVVPLRGVPHRIVHRAGERGTVWTETRDSGEKITVRGRWRRAHRPSRPRLSQARGAQGPAEGRARLCARRSACRVKRVSIRDQSSRWGSCTSAGSLSFSWRLILAPPFVLDYLAAHEVAHLVEMNHSARFWRVGRPRSAAMSSAPRAGSTPTATICTATGSRISGASGVEGRRNPARRQA